MRRVSIALVLVLNLAAPLFAWSDAGHKIIASIAYSELTEKEGKCHPLSCAGAIYGMAVNRRGRFGWINVVEFSPS